eukprot:335539-Pelagomonas_calceolata.AAC.3
MGKLFHTKPEACRGRADVLVLHCRAGVQNFPYLRKTQDCVAGSGKVRQREVIAQIKLAEMLFRQCPAAWRTLPLLP